MKPRLSARGAKPDRRVERTRKALVEAFNGLLFERRYDHIKIADVIARADVGRSTFYEHFADKEALLSESIRRPFAVLAGAVDARGTADDLRRVVEHFWDNQAQARFVFAGAARRAVARILAGMIEERIAAAPLAREGIPVHLVAVALADALLGAITAWLAGEATCSAAALAAGLRAMAQGALGSPRAAR